MISDFGIALAVGVAGGGRLTETGLSLGTPHYMSPEQATGDLRVGVATDIYALGCVLYEMLVGEPPYTGSTAQAILGKIIQAKPISATEARRSVPPNVDAAIRKALEKLPADRFVTVQDFADALADSRFRHGDAVTSGALGAHGLWNPLSMVTTGLVLLLSLALGWMAVRPEPIQPTWRILMSGEGWTGVDGPLGSHAAIAPDGSSMVLPIESGADEFQLGLKMRGSADITPIPGTEGARHPDYSPDGQSIAYVQGAELLRRPVGGGGAVSLAGDVNEAGNVTVTWLDNEVILYEQLHPDDGESLVRISEDGADRVTVPRSILPIWTHGLPDGRKLSQP